MYFHQLSGAHPNVTQSLHEKNKCFNVVYILFVFAGEKPEAKRRARDPKSIRPASVASKRPPKNRHCHHRRQASVKRVAVRPRRLKSSLQMLKSQRLTIWSRVKKKPKMKTLLHRCKPSHRHRCKPSHRQSLKIDVSVDSKKKRH